MEGNRKRNIPGRRDRQKKPYLSFRERYAEHAVDPEKSYRATKYLRPGIAEPSS